MSLRRLIALSPVAVRATTAVVLLAVTLGDLTLDGACDPLPTVAGEEALCEAAEGDTDACARGCIPDCFCCSRTLGAQPRVSPPAPQGAVAAAVMEEPVLPPGVSRLTEHPPRARV